MSKKTSEHTVGLQCVSFNGTHRVLLRNIIGTYTGWSKISVHLTITVHNQVHGDFLITLYYHQTQPNFNNIINQGPKHVAFIDNIIKSLLCRTEIYMPILYSSLNSLNQLWASVGPPNLLLTWYWGIFPCRCVSVAYIRVRFESCLVQRLNYIEMFPKILFFIKCR
jgi:hypothetical protein